MDRLSAVCPACMELITTCGYKKVQHCQVLMLNTNQICMIKCTYDAVGCTYLIGLQVALEAVEYAESQSRL